MTEVATEPADAAPGAAKPPHHRGRRIAGTTLVVISCILAPISGVAIWVRNQVLNTDRYVSNVAPLAANHHIIDTAATQITTALFNHVDVAETIESVLPARASFLGSPVAAALRDLTQRTALAALSSKQFQTIWKEANRVAHEQLKS